MTVADSMAKRTRGIAKSSRENDLSGSRLELVSKATEKSLANERASE